ncbi:cytokine receptor [Tribolium castaneum]|uniref:Domeless n=1 Tax=Tribolium castaneum TaxID=7070 RepID=D7EJN5_TRICA|nr:PREDICTED: cytokine receptor [Tribolium castaneum]EFA12822.1 domeless [Tribolium castaneum]|eukprot:XP_001807060.1 PREDICTED: cytokine receptor [Tribolium castaneum]
MDLKRWGHFYMKVFLLFGTGGLVLAMEPMCSPGLDFGGYTVPQGDIVIEYGNPLDIICVLLNNSKNILGPDASLNLSFVRNQDAVPPEMIEVINSTAIKLHIDKPPKVSSDTYSCLQYNKSAVCMNCVTVGTKPQPVTDFECISYNYDNLTCTWTPPENYIKTTYNLTFTLGGRAARYIQACPHIDYSEKTKRMSCMWNVSTTPQYRQVHEVYNFNLTMENKFGTHRQSYPFQHFAHVLSGPPENLTVINTTSSSIYLYWMVPLSMRTFWPGVHHRILYQCEYYEKKWHFGGEIKENPKRYEIYFNLTNLKYAHALCDIRVSLRSAKALPSDESMWSNNASITVWTSSKIPDEPPETNVGSFEVVAFGNSLQNREAYVYWKQIKEEQKNGPDFHYGIAVEGEPAIRPVEFTNTYAKFENLSISTSYTFNIWSENSNGTSARKSSVFIPKQTDRIKEPWSFTKVEFGDGVYELTWVAPKLLDNQYITNYTIFSCSNERDRPYQCNGMLNWTVVSSNTTSKTMIVEKNKIFQFAISANTHNGSSGMLWASCTVIHNKNMGKMKNVWINSVGSTFIEVGWKLDCADRIGSVEGYVVYYCPIKSPMHTECKAPQANRTFDGTSMLSSGNITDLNPYTTYMLTVSVKTKHTTFSQQSDPLYNTTLEDAPSTPPRDVTIQKVTNSSIRVAWKPPEALNGIIRDYVVYCCVKGSLCEKIPVKTELNYTITGLKSFENYSIELEACTTKCSGKSERLQVTTSMGYPSKIRKPTVDLRNDTSITIVWNEPEEPSGRNDYYVVQFRQKHKSENKTFQYNTTKRKFVIENCGDGGKFNAFYISVKAVNKIDNRSYDGPWSDELENYCETPINYIMYLLLFVAIVAVVSVGFFSTRLYNHCKFMRDVEVKLPPGLAPVVADHTLVPWSTEKRQDPGDSHSPPDEELLLVKMSEGRHFSGDSSGCSSGHESVTSSLESGTHISSSSDSGTEQPAAYSVMEASSDTPYISVTGGSEASSPYVMTGDAVKTINPGYIPFTQPPDFGGGLDAKGDSPYISVTATDATKMGYKPSSEVSDESSPYVMTGDAPKTINPGYIPFNQTEPMKNSYVHITF